MQERELFNIFKEKRESHGITIEEISRKTGLSHKVIKNIEEGNTKEIHPVYLKGFVKIYADFLGIDAKDILDNISTPARVPKVLKEKKTVDRKSIRSSVIKKAVKTGRFRNVMKVIGITAISLVVIFSLRNLISQFSRMISDKKETKEMVFKRRDTKAKKAMTSEEKKEASDKVVSKERVSEKGNLLNVELFARRTVYIEVKVDSKVVYSGIFVQGFSEIFKAKKEIFVRAGNGDALEVQINGRYIGALSRKKGTIEAKITSSGIKILR